MQRDTSGVSFTERHTPPWWLRVPLWGLPPGWIAFGWFTGGADGAAGAAVGATIVLLFLTVPVEVGQSQRLYGGVRVAGGRLHVGRRSVPVAALDLSSMTFEAGAEVFAVLGKGRLMSNPMWLRKTVALDGCLEGRPVRVVVGTNRRDELVAALRANAAAVPDEPA